MSKLPRRPPAHVTAHSRFVARSRRFLWLLVVAVVLGVVWLASDHGDQKRVVLSSASKPANVQNVMAKPHFQGIDKHNRPYTVIAEEGTQLDAEHMVLHTAQADMTMQSGAWVAVHAGTAHMNTTTKQLDLTDRVALFYEGGYEFRSDRAHIDIPQGSAYGDSPVEGQGPPGTLLADRFSIFDHGSRIRFDGSVKVHLYR